MTPETRHTSPDTESEHLGDGLLRRAADLRNRFLVTLPFTIIVLGLSMVPPLQFPGWQWVVAFASLPVVIWGAAPFHRAAFQAGRHGSSTMDTLVSLGVIASSLWSWYALLFGGAGMIGMRMHMSLIPASSHATHAEIYFEGACAIVTFLLAGRLMEARTRYHSGDALRSLLELGAKDAILVEGSGADRQFRTIPAAELRVGNLFQVRPGDKVATDGIVEEGTSALDTSLMTGESLPREVSPGSAVTGGTLNTSGALIVRATAVGSETQLAHIGQMITEAQATKAPVQRLADRISSVFVPTIIALSLLTLAGWLLAGAGIQSAITAAVAVLVVACPCALGLATPTALLVGSGKAAQMGILISSAEVLERTRSIDTILLDKTGTLTKGAMSLESVILPDGSANSPDAQASVDALSVTASLESASEHPIARALTTAARERDLSSHPVRELRNHPGLGVSALAEDGALLLAGRVSWLGELGISLPQSALSAISEAEATGATVVASARVEGWQESSSTEDASAQASQPAEEAEDGGIIVDMAVGGMTCASCVRRVERKLGKLDGVHAQVNLATESARITLKHDYSDAELEEVVKAAGYEPQVRSRRLASAQAPTATLTAQTRELPEHLNGVLLGAFVVRDTVKESSRDAIAQLKALGITPTLLTGDHESAARFVASQVGIDSVIAGVLPADKRDAVMRLQEEGHQVAMVGDGVNDAAALAQASTQGLGIAMGSGADSAIAVADMTLVSSDPTMAAAAIRISRATLKVIKENLFWAFFYNVIMIPLAIFGLLNPMLASAAMAMSSVYVVLNSMRLRRAH
ncbi:MULTISPECIES: HAD-IC family P-type ATPase [Actinomyces]|uniref:HAD-IC family P-type ATPase n=1 Tax=Actinomyces TaxID=1654 RepID=UPI0009315ABE|nr:MULTISPECIES: HAD-IC family P-type ATPase [Actinomyces]